jgi:bacterioferritin-associated ferredoxin
MESNEIVCTCMEVYKQDIVKAIREKNLKTVDEVSEATEAGTVCGGCRPVIEEILKEVNR